MDTESIYVATVAVSAVFACWFFLEAGCAVVSGVGNCILF